MAFRLAGQSFAVSSTVTIIESPPAGAGVTPLVSNKTNGDSVPLPIGTPVFASAAGVVKRAKADAFASSVVVGLVQDDSIDVSANGTITLGGDLLTATTAQWDAVAGTTGGLTAGTPYYLSATTPGKLTASKPIDAGQFIEQIGVGLSPTEMAVGIWGPRPAGTSRLMFALWGQSNAFGQAATGDLTNSQRLNIGNGYTNVNFRQKSSQPAAADPIVWNTDSFGSLSSYTATQNNNSGHGIDGTGLGPAQSLGRHLDYFKRNKNDIACIAVSGSTLQTHWLPTGSFPSGGTNLFQQAIAETNSAMAQFGSQITGFFWVQGETDATDATAAANYEANLTALFNAVRAAYGPIPIVFTQLSAAEGGAHAATVRTAQANVAAAFPNCTMVVTDDVNLGNDAVHYTADGYAALGDRMAAAMIDLLGWSSPVAWTIDKYSLIGIPQNATEWNAVLTAAGPYAPSAPPSALYLMQEANGNLADSIGAFPLTSNAGGGVTYHEATADWNAKVIDFAEGSGEEFATTSASLPDPATTSQARLFFAWIVSNTVERNCYLQGTAGFAAVARTAAGSTVEIADGGNKTVGGTAVVGSMRPYFHVRNVPFTLADLYTDNEHVSGTHGSVTGKSNTIGCHFGNPRMLWAYCADWYGTSAQMNINTAREILQLLNWGNVNLGATAIPW